MQTTSSFESSEPSQESSDDQIQNIDLMYTNDSKSESSMSSSGPPSPVNTSLGKHKFQEPQLFSSDSDDSDLAPKIKQKKSYYSPNHEERSTDCLDSKKIVLNSFDSDSEDY